MHPRSAVALRQVLLDYFRVPVEIEQFVGVWRPVEEESQCSLGEGDRRIPSGSGFGAVVGDEVWDQQSRMRIRLGPMTLDQYEDFLPGGEAFRRIRVHRRFLCRKRVRYGIAVDSEANRRPALRTGLRKGPQLGWTSWVKSAEFERDPGETILEL